jgi:superfamily II DNA or RNA helicase
VRDAEWLVRRVDKTSTGGYRLSVVGVSELVRNQDAMFLTEIDTSIEILDPARTKLVRDFSSSYRDTILYMESLLRQTSPADAKLCIGPAAAMDVNPYQLDPAIQALREPRQRILIADAVGLGKTIACGVLLSELIRRGRGQRILVLAVKSMLTQFQKEMWSRFTIPLIRLDSTGIQRIRTRIPSNSNPFFYFDKSIISIDTLKQDREYRTYLEQAYWDVIVIDEAHNVAERRGGSSLRAKLAKLLMDKSDSLIMLSATPHDGSAGSFASLMNMLDPTAIADPEHYGPEDIKGLFIRRFKKDIQEQAPLAFKERTIGVARATASAAEEAAYEQFVNTSFTRVNTRDKTGKLFKTTLEKALFSSPYACLKTIHNRVSRLKNLQDTSYDEDIRALEDLADVVKRITPQHFSKYRKLLEVIASLWKWTPHLSDDRLVIFTERIETLKFLHEHLKRDLGLKAEQISVLHGSLPDTEQQEVVENFGRDESPIRLLIASDVAAEGINLHYLCHRMIHFDIPWSLMVFQQRNGRIDRYGQEKTPEILYLVTDSANAKIKGDTRILEILIQKDKEAVKNIGDPSALMGVYDIDLEEKKTAEAIEKNVQPEQFEASLSEANVDPLELLLGLAQEPPTSRPEEATARPPSLFPNDFAYVKTALGKIRQDTALDVDIDEKAQHISVTMHDELWDRFKALPPEVLPEDRIIRLTTDKKIIHEEIKRSRKDEKAWPKIHYLWPLNPVVEWINDKVVAAFGRHEAPVVVLDHALKPGETVFVMNALIPNLRGHPMLQEWFGVVFHGDTCVGIDDLSSVLERTGFGATQHANSGAPVNLPALQDLLPQAVERAKSYMSECWKAFENDLNEKLNAHLQDLERLKKRKFEALEKRLAQSSLPEKRIAEKRESETRAIEKIFDSYWDWVEQTMTTEDKPYIRVAAVLKGRD